MRIATSNNYDVGVDTLARRQSDMLDLQSQITTGKRVSKASDDPAAAARAERALAGIERDSTSQRAIDAANASLTQSESTLGNAATLLQNARQLLVAAGNASYADSDRKTIADQLQSLRSQLLSLANSDDGAGSYLFAGQGSTQKPFVDAAGGVQYAAAPGRIVTDDGNLPLTTDGQASWMGARTGNGVFVTSAAPSVTGATIDSGTVSDPSALTGANYTLRFSVAAGTTTYAVLKNGAPTAVTAAPYVSGQAITVDGMSVTVSGTPANGDSFGIAPSTPTLGVFSVLDKAIAGLSTPGRTGSQIAQADSENLRDVDQVMNNLQAARSAAGSLLNRVDTETSRIADATLANQTVQSNATDVDMVHALSAFQSMQTGYDAALKSYASVQQLSLFQYVNAG